MSNTDRAPLAVYRLLPSLGEFRMLGLDMSPGIQLARWTRSHSTADRPTSLSAHWIGEPEWRAAEFPSSSPYAPMLSRRIADLLQDDFLAAGSFLPVFVEGGTTAEYVLYLVEKIVDCLDTRRSSKPKKSGDPLKKAVFQAEALPSELPAFRIPDSPRAVYWNRWAVDRLSDLVGDDLEARLIWSEDPTLTPHPNPWGLF